MCGIAAIVSNNAQRLQPELMDRAVACMRHRGPQRQRHWADPSNHCILGHARLSIIDLDARADGPFRYGRYTLAYNGELYNYVELREELRAAGASFTTDSDTEVVAAAWAVWGSACLNRFDGAFAFAIWDEEQHTLFAARDRFGEKPLFFHFSEDTVLLASELKALWTLGVPRKANDALAYNFLTIGYVVNPFDAQETFFEEVRKLPAGSWLQYRPGATELTIEQFGAINIVKEAPPDDIEAIAHFTHLLETSVKRRLRSDVAVGTSLSGGLDSATVAALCKKVGGEHYTHCAFTAVFPGFEKNEEARAALVAGRLGLRQELVTIDDASVPALMDRVMAHQEEPVGSASALAQFRVFEAARASGVTVLLDGQGADELLGGYDKYYRWYWQELYANRQLGASGELAAARALGVQVPFGKAARLGALFPQFAASILEGRKARSAKTAPGLNAEWAKAQAPYFYYMLPPRFTLNDILHYNTFTNGLEELLRLADRNAMAHSVEVRLPFLSADLAHFLFSLPAKFKIRGGRTKWILRAAMRDLLPAEVVQEVRKTGFEPPQERWMALPAVQERIRAACEKLVAAGILDPSVLQKKIQPHGSYAAAGQYWKYWTLSYLY